MNIATVITAFCSISFLMIGADKFLGFIEPPCSVMNNFSPLVWRGIGVLQLAGSILIWIPSLKKYIAGFFVVFMLGVSTYHLINNTTDIGGAVGIAVLLGLLVWNPRFIRGKDAALN